MRCEIKPSRSGETRRKLAELQTKTDADLTVLLQHAIERSFQAVDRGAYSQAEADCTKVGLLLPLLRNLPVKELGTLRADLETLRAELWKAPESSALAAS